MFILTPLRSADHRSPGSRGPRAPKPRENLAPHGVVPVSKGGASGHGCNPPRPAAQDFVFRAEEDLGILAVRKRLKPRIRQEIRGRPLPDVTQQLQDTFWRGAGVIGARRTRAQV